MSRMHDQKRRIDAERAECRKHCHKATCKLSRDETRETPRSGTIKYPCWCACQTCLATRNESRK